MGIVAMCSEPRSTFCVVKAVYRVSGLLLLGLLGSLGCRLSLGIKLSRRHMAYVTFGFRV